MKKWLRLVSCLLLTVGAFGCTGCLDPRAKALAPKPTSLPQQTALTSDHSPNEMFQGGCIRGNQQRHALALAFTGHGFAEGGATILQELQKHHAKGSFFLTGVFLTNQDFQPLIQRIAADGHYFSIHSDQHLLYCSWDQERKTLITREEFQADVEMNFRRYEQLKPKQLPGRYFIPPFEHYNPQLVDWANQQNLTVISYTPGTRSNADYTGEADKNFVSSQTIFDSIIKREQTDPHGLNGFILLLHLGSGPGRADKFHAHFGELLDYLTGQGYEFVRVDELLEAKAKP